MNTDLVHKETSDLVVDLISRNEVLELEISRLRTENRHLKECRRVTRVVMNHKKAELKAALSKRKSETCKNKAVEQYNRGRKCEKVLRLRSGDVPCEMVTSDLSDSDSESASDASCSDQFDLEIDMVDQPSRAQSSSSAIINEGRRKKKKKRKKSDNTKRRNPLPEKRKRRRRVVIDDDSDDEGEKEGPDDSDAKQFEHERVTQEIGPIKADMEESSNWSLRVSVSDSDNKSECSEIDVVGIDEEIPEQIEPMAQTSPVIEKQIVAKKSRKRLADELPEYGIVEPPTLVADSFIKGLIVQQAPRESDNPILPNTMQVRIAGRVARERLHVFGLMAQLDDLKEQRRLLPAPREFFILLSPSRKTCRFCGENTHFTDLCPFFRTLAEREEEVK
ncbi:hypothetical protein WR25_26699 isoform E [Diploscapter pachys]|nr:hypothetical protein WR25_26699 isoform E [Diploscapter pachys]